MDEWRSDPELCRKAELALKDPIIRQMLDVIRCNHISQNVFPNTVGTEIRAFFQAKGEGYTLCLNDFEALAVHSKPVEPIEATFGADET